MSSKRLSRVQSSIPTGGPDRGMLGRKAVAAKELPQHDRKVPPLWWWRRLPAQAFTSAHHAVLKRATSGFGHLSEPLWAVAAKGDAAAAVGIALRTFRRCPRPSPGVDLTMSVLLRCAIEGSGAAALVLSHVLARIADEDPGCALLASSWRSIKVAGQLRLRLKRA